MDDELVQVEVVVNVEGLRRGWVGQVELTDRIQMLIRRGYLRLLGHVVVAASEPSPVAPVVPELAAPTGPPTARPRRSRAKGKPTTALTEGGDGRDQGGV